MISWLIPVALFALSMALLWLWAWLLYRQSEEERRKYEQAQNQLRASWAALAEAVGRPLLKVLETFSARLR